jgi:hypothetical protein
MRHARMSLAPTSGSFTLTEPTRVAVAAWIAKAGLTSGSYLFPSRQHESLHLSIPQCARIVKR